MPKASDPSLFHLVKSLSKSEWRTLLLHFEKNPWNPNSKKKAVQDTQRFIEALRSLDFYDKPSIMGLLGLPNTSKGMKVYRDLKGHAEKITLKAIEASPRNMTKKSMLFRTMILIPLLLEKGLYEKSERILQRQIKIASELEEFEAEKVLLKLLDQVFLNHPQFSSGLEKLEEVSQRRRDLGKILTEIDDLQNLKNKLSLSIKLDRTERTACAHEIIIQPIILARSRFSLRGRVLGYEILRQGSLLVGNHQTFQKANKNIEKAYNSNPELFSEGEMAHAYLATLFSNAEIQIMQHNFSRAKKEMKRLSEYSNSLSGFDKEFGYELHLLASLQLSRVKLDAEMLEASPNYLDLHLRQYINFSKRPKYALAILRVGEASFLLGKWSEAIKWLSKMKYPPASVHRPFLSKIAYFIILMARIEQNNYDQVEYELKSLRKVLASNNPQNEMFSTLLKFFKDWLSRNSPAQQKSLYQENLKILKNLTAKKGNSRILNYFGFLKWFESKITGESMLSLHRKDNHPSKTLE